MFAGGQGQPRAGRVGHRDRNDARRADQESRNDRQVGTSEFLTKLGEASTEGEASDLIGQFGVGFYSSFLGMNGDD